MTKSKPTLRTSAIADDALLNKICEFRGKRVQEIGIKNYKSQTEN